MRPRPPRVWLRAFPIVVALASASGVAAGASLTVPDDVPTIRAAMDSLYSTGAVAETVWVRSGVASDAIEANVPVDLWVIGVTQPGQPKPEIAGVIVIDDLGGGGGAPHFENIRFTDRVESLIDWPVEFIRCAMDSDVVVSVDRSYGVRLFGCTLQSVRSSRGNLEIDSCSVAGSIFVNGGDEAALAVRKSTVAAGIGGRDLAGCAISNNVIHGEVFLQRGTGLAVTDNQIDGAGIRVLSDDPGLIAGNRIRNCTTGVEVLGYGGAEVRDNAVLGASGRGMSLSITGGSIHHNVVGRSGADGVFVADVFGKGLPEVHHNTSYANAGSGFSFAGGPFQETLVFSNNLAFGNRAHGLETTGDVGPTLECNDWFGNDSSAVSGTEAAGTDLSVDPLLCDVDQDDVRLAADSPLLNAPGCGPIGALGQGCESTPTLISLFTVERRPDGVRVRWQTSALNVELERAPRASGPWQTIALESSRDGDVIVAWDRAVPLDECWYRLVSRTGGGTLEIGAPIVAPALPLRFELHAVMPNPAAGEVEFSFALASGARVELDVFDVQGRPVSHWSGAFSPGVHRVRWPRTAGAPVASGRYFVRYRYPGGQQTRSFVRIR